MKVSFQLSPLEARDHRVRLVSETQPPSRYSHNRTRIWSRSKVSQIAHCIDTLTSSELCYHIYHVYTVL